MAKRRRTHRRTYRRHTYHAAPPRRRRTRRRRHNPGRARRYASRAYSAGRGILGGIHFMGAVKAAVPMLLGAIAAKFAAKKFAASGGELDNWSWKNYLLALAGGGVAAIATSAIIRGRGNIAQKVFEGAMLIVGYKIFTTELAPQNATLNAWFGSYGQLPYGAPEYGQIYQGDQTDYITGADQFYRPVDESHRLPEMAGFGEEVVSPTPGMGGYGEEVVSPTPGMGSYGDAREIAAQYEKAFG